MSQSELDSAAILTALGVPDATRIERVSGGTDTAIWRVERGADAFALRLFRPEQAEVCQREVAVTSAAASAGIPVPRVHAVGAWQGRPALLLSWCAGQPLLGALLAKPWTIWPLGLQFGRTQAAIHALPPPPLLRQDADAWVRWAGPNEEPLQQHLRALPTRASALLHLDYHPLNVMTDGKHITGVLDWANTRAGDPRADVARTFTLLRLAPLGPGRQPPHLTFFRWLLSMAWRRGYEQVAGPLVGMVPFYAWAGAVMLRDLAPRVGRADDWMQDHHFNPIRRWTAAWKQRVGL